MRFFAFFCANFRKKWKIRFLIQKNDLFLRCILLITKHLIIMEKTKLLEMRKFKGFTQQQIADHLNMTDSSYSRREKGEVNLNIKQWEKLAKVLDVPLGEIFEPDEQQVVICNNSSSVNYQGSNNNYTIPESLLETQRKYIATLEKEIEELKRLLENR